MQYLAERLWDALAMLLIVAGTTLFLMARNGLTSLASGTHKLPTGVQPFVQRADYFSAQSSGRSYPDRARHRGGDGGVHPARAQTAGSPHHARRRRTRCACGLA